MRLPPLPRSLQVLSSPQAVVASVLTLNKGYGSLFGFLALEYLLNSPLDVAGHAMRLSFSPTAAVLGLWSGFVHFAIPPALVVFALGTILYYGLRFRGRRIDIWAAASVVTYAWVPHLLLVAVGVVVGAGWGPLPWLPQFALDGPSVPMTVQLLRLSLAFGPSGVLLVLLVKAAWLQRPVDSAPATRRPIVTAAVASMVLVLGLVFAGLQIGRDWRQVRPVMPNDAVPTLRLVSLDGVELANDSLTEKVALIDFWATWCAPCVAAMPGLESLHQEFGAQGFVLVSVSTEPDNIDGVRAFLRQHRLTFPVYLDAGGLQRQFNVQTYPTAVLVDRHGKVREVYIGGLSHDALRRAVQALLQE